MRRTDYRWGPGLLALFGLALLLDLSPVSVGAQEYGLLGEDVVIPIPEGWMLLGDSTGFPAQLLFDADSAEILFFRSTLDGEDMIHNDEELHQSVKLVVEDVIQTLPGGQLATSTGFYDGFRAGFTLEFESTDSATGVPLQHSLCGLLYRSPEDFQYLFTVWGKAAVTTYPLVEDDIKTVQSGFVYQGEFVDEVFVGDRFKYWPLILVAMAIIGVMLIRPLRRRRLRPTAERNAG